MKVTKVNQIQDANQQKQCYDLTSYKRYLHLYAKQAQVLAIRTKQNKLRYDQILIGYRLCRLHVFPVQANAEGKPTQ